MMICLIALHVRNIFGNTYYSKQKKIYTYILRHGEALHADICTLLLAKQLNTDWENGVGAQEIWADCTSDVLKMKKWG